MYAVCTHLNRLYEAILISAHNIHLKNRTPKISQNYLHCASWCGTISNLPRLELPLSRTNFHGPKGVRAIEVRLYLELHQEKRVRFRTCKTGLSTIPPPPRPPPQEDSYWSFQCCSSVAVLLCLCVGGFLCDVLFSLFVLLLSFFWCLGRAVLRDCNISFFNVIMN